MAPGERIDLVAALQMFNRKERFFLVGRALGNPAFEPSAEFRRELGAVLNVDVPAQCFCAMDYHLDWLFGALHMSANGVPSAPLSRNDGEVQGNIEDVDLMLAFTTATTHHVVLLEAKAESSWTNEQMRSKAARLRAIFGDDGARWPGVRPSVVLMSPSRPGRLDTRAWPAWMAPDGQFRWLRLALPEGLHKLTRCDAQGRDDERGTHWRVDRTR
ncbi:MAG: hypothetical protein U0326_38120 [Polyangiales bacterium]